MAFAKPMEGLELGGDVEEFMGAECVGDAETALVGWELEMCKCAFSEWEL